MEDILLSGKQITLEEAEVIKRAFIKATEVFEKHGYKYIRPSFFDSYEHLKTVLNTKVEEAITFKYLEKLISLRTDFTPLVIKTVKEFRNVEFPVKLYYFGTVFKGIREEVHTGIEYLGSENIEADAEVISLIYEYLKSLGLNDLIVSVGHVNIVNTILEELDKDIREKVKRAFLEKNLSFLRDAFGKGSFIAELPLLQGGKEVLEYLKDEKFRKVREELEKLGNLLEEKNVNFIYDLSEVREYPYYTGVVFEIFHPSAGVPLGGGGRYNSLPEVYGLNIPATGGGVYISRLVELMINGKEPSS